jgi:hypothetical protein
MDQPTEGRWLTPDPMGGDLTNPQSLNRYAYALNNPETLTDPLGTNPSDCTANANGGVTCTGPDTVTVNGGTPPQVPILIGPCSYEATEFAACYGGSSPAPPGWVPFPSSGGGGGTGGGSAPAPKPTPPKPDVPLNPFATAVFHRVYCGTQFLDRLPKISGGGGFFFFGPSFTVPLTPVKGEVLGVVNYDTSAGVSAGFIGEAGAGPFSVGVGRTYNFSSGSSSSETLGFFGAEREGASVGVLGGGALVTTQGSVGLYGQIGMFGGGGYLNLSYNGCSL